MPRDRRDIKRAVAQLGHRFATSGYVRSGPKASGGKTHRGYELRFGACDAEDAEHIVDLLRVIDVEPGKPFAHHSGFRVPVYGYEQVRRLLLAISPKHMKDAGVL